MKAVALISGGLDSTLAARLIQDSGIELIALNTKTPFCLCDKPSSSGCLHSAALAAKTLGLKLTTINVTDEFLRILKEPRHGYGSNMNPCLDCRILLFKKAKELMQKEGASFVVTGEVLGQRPMSQHRQALRLIEKESGLDGLVLRPLCARLLPETIPERELWVNRAKLLGFSGRSRRMQMDLAKTFHIRDYPCAAGGCLLTDPAFSRRIKDLIAHGKLDSPNVELLKLGRHFRLAQNTKLVVGRDEKENTRLFGLLEEGDHLFTPRNIAGPTALARGDLSKELIHLACGITCRYCDLNGSKTAEMIYKRFPGQEEKILEASALGEEEFAGLRI